MLELLNNFDVAMLLWINGHHTILMDQVMLFASAKFTWIPFYLLLLFLIIKKYKYRAIIVLLFAAITITLNDQTSVHLFKNVFQRLRPCHQPEVVEHLRMIVGCGGQYGFVSSHAANSFGIVAFIALLFKKKWITIMMIVWGLLIIYSRVYLGVHYPFDVLAGSIVGVIIGIITAALFFVVDKNWGYKLNKSFNN